MSTERANKYLQTTHKTVPITTIASRGDGNLHWVSFIKILQDNKSVRKSHEDYFIDKFKVLLNEKTYVA